MSSVNHRRGCLNHNFQQNKFHITLDKMPSLPLEHAAYMSHIVYHRNPQKYLDAMYPGKYLVIDPKVKEIHGWGRITVLMLETNELIKIEKRHR